MKKTSEKFLRKAKNMKILVIFRYAEVLKKIEISVLVLEIEVSMVGVLVDT